MHVLISHSLTRVWFRGLSAQLILPLSHILLSWSIHLYYCVRIKPTLLTLQILFIHISVAVPSNWNNLFH